MGLESVRHKIGFDSHVNDSRTIVALLSSPGESPIIAKQVRIAFVHKDSTVGNHYRDCCETYGIIGEANFVLEDIRNKERKTFAMKTGDQLFVPPRIGLRVDAKKGAIIACCSEDYNIEGTTHKYTIE